MVAKACYPHLLEGRKRERGKREREGKEKVERKS